MEFLEEETRPRFLLHSRGPSFPDSVSEPQRINKLQLAVCASVSLITTFIVFFFFQSQTLQFFLLWVAVSLIVGPLAPLSLTGGDVRVGRGEIVEFPDQDAAEVEESRRVNAGRRSKPRRVDDVRGDGAGGPVHLAEGVVLEKCEKTAGGSFSSGEGSARVEEREWVEEDFEVLKKQMLKHPVGEPRRWEMITEAFQGRHGLESVIKMGKSMSEKRVNGGDPFAQFLKQRKPLDRRVEAPNGNLQVGSPGNGGTKTETEVEGMNASWTSGEDLALLNALKAFPKDTSMRWDKIAAAVPGKSKACCLKRVAELKRDFRVSKASEAAGRAD